MSKPKSVVVLFEESLDDSEVRSVIYVIEHLKGVRATASSDLEEARRVLSEKISAALYDRPARAV